MSDAYDYPALTVLSAIEGMRKRPGMYVGDVGPRGLAQVLWELVGNAIDEHLAGRCTTLSVTLEQGGWVVVEDDGRGIPVEPGADGRSLLEVALTDFHDRPTLDGHKPHAHLSTAVGLGLVVVNALSAELEVDSRSAGRHFRVTCADQKPTPPLDLGPADRSGTRVRFRPDPLIFGTATFAHSTIATRLEELAALCPGLDVQFADERRFRFNSPGGIRALLPPKEHFRRVPQEPLYGRLERDGVEAEVALQWATSRHDEVAVRAFANLLETGEGGTHVAGLRSGLHALAEATGALDPKAALKPLTARLVAIVAVRNFEPEYAGPTRAKLKNPEITPIVRELVEAVLGRFATERPDEARAVVEAVLAGAQV